MGRWFEAFVKRRNRNASASFQELEDKKELSEESEDEEPQLEEFPMLKTLDPKDWKVRAPRHLCRSKQLSQEFQRTVLWGGWRREPC